MPDYKALNEQLAKGLKGSIAYTDQRVGWLGKISAADTINPDPSEDLEQGFVWVRFDNNGEAIRARCHKVSARMPDMPVRVGRDVVTKEWTVIEIVPMDWGKINDLASTFSVPDRNPDYIYEEFDANRFKDLHVEPGEDAFDVKVEPGFYWWQGEIVAFEGETINIISSVPTTGGFGGSKRGVLIGIDPATNTLTTFDGDVLGILEIPGNGGKYFTATYIADTVNDADPDVYWIALIPITSTDSNWSSLYRVTALTLVNGLGVRDFVDLGDVPSAYTGHSLKAVRVNAGETGLEFFTASTVASLDDLTDVVITSPNPLDALYYTGFYWANGDVYVRNTGDSMTGALSITHTDTALSTASTFTLGADDASAHAGVNSLFAVNQNGFNLTANPGAAGSYNIISVTGASGTVTGAAGFYGSIIKSGTGTLINAYGGYIATALKLAGTLTNVYGLYIQSQTAGSNNYAIYTNAGLNVLGDQLSIIGSANRVQEIIKANATQTADLAQYQNSSGTVLSKFTSDADLELTNNSSKQNVDTARFTARNNIVYGTSGSKFPNGGIYSLEITPVVASVSGSATGINIAAAVSGSQSFGGTLYGAQIQATNQTTTSVTAVVGAMIRAGTSTSAGASSISNLYAILAGPNPYQGGAFTTTISNSYSGWFGVNGSFEKTAITNLYGVYVNSHTPGSGSSIANQYGVYVENQASGGTLNYAIYTNSGLVRLGDSVVLADAKNFTFGTGTGTKFGTSTSEKMAWWNATPVAQSAGWSMSNYTPAKTLDGSTAMLADVINVLGTLIDQYKTYGQLGA